MGKRLLLIGAPGSGKGTQAKNLVKLYGYKHVSTGDLLRAAIANKSELGKKAKDFMDKGALVPDELVNQIVLENLKALENDKIILDGYPRTLGQAEFLNQNNINLDVIIYLQVALDEVLDRMSGRLTCGKCGASFHLKNQPPKKEMICDDCSATLVIRSDDQPETVKKRYQTFLEQTEPVLSYYKNKTKIHVIEAVGDIQKINKVVEGIAK